MYRLFSDLDLANALYKGDSHAFKELYTRHAEGLLRLAMAKLGFEQDAEDCVQEVFCNFWQHCLDRQSPFLSINLEAYLVTSVKHYVFRHYKKQLQSKLVKQQMAAETLYAEAVEDRVAQQEITRLLQHELEDMPEQMRKVFEMSRRQHLSIQQIATELDLSEQTVKNHMGRALRRLRLRLGPQLLNFFL
ncbi:hypothetical protein A4H97_21530 [Niastella yeongjuensis]|uniref:HTH luxR-type domain-containing protein n=1 Tax=Niastella yeongjuensis TaxID=354355 RepID=A0A1V9F812_9BACT|nr:sigma-70 family RNA polymerase sigma factor [Niastella yeongjuensis]OQP54553.1 hypothetical protein A4H97_21530 [Niastella yeongjuensis]SEN98799.1 RNA polymerase sigma-70 factor, ECF subfamily [Niastella yeongjuensis]